MQAANVIQPSGRAAVIGISVAIAYIGVAAVLEYVYQMKLSTFIDGAASSLSPGDPENTERIVAASADAPKRGPILRFLLMPLPATLEMTTAGSSGAIFMGIIAQGIWLGLAAWGFSRASTNGLVLVAALLAIAAPALAALILGVSALGLIASAMPLLGIALGLAGMFRRYGG